jgi:hypothetical protein
MAKCHWNVVQADSDLVDSGQPIVPAHAEIYTEVHHQSFCKEIRRVNQRIMGLFKNVTVVCQGRELLHWSFSHSANHYSLVRVTSQWDSVIGAPRDPVQVHPFRTNHIICRGSHHGDDHQRLWLLRRKWVHTDRQSHS